MSLPNKKIGKLLFIRVDYFAALSVAFLTLGLVTTGLFWPVEIYNLASHWLLILALALIPAAILCRRWPTHALLSIGGLAFLWLFGGLFIPRTIAPATHYPDLDKCSLRVMTYNLSNGLAQASSLTDGILNSSADLIRDPRIR